MLNAKDANSGAPTRRPLSVDDARLRILEALPAAVPEMICLEDSLQRISAAAVRAPCDQPPFDTAAMDGWAVGGIEAGFFRPVGESRAGRGYGRRLAAGEAIRISTGAPVPAGAERVVRWEDSIDRGGLIVLPAMVVGKRDIRSRACDFQAGDVLLLAGKRIDHLDVARLAAGGIEKIPVGKRPKIAILATGDEIALPGVPPRADQIRDALSLPVAMRAKALGAQMSPVIQARDDARSIEQVVAGLAVDIIIVIGGASRGLHDHARTAFEVYGLTILVPAVRMRPGKPFWFGTLHDGRFVVGLPGNPVAALASMELFVGPLLRHWQGDIAVQPEIQLIGTEPVAIDASMDRIHFGCLRFDGDGHATAVRLGGSDSAALAPLMGADLVLRQRAGEDRLTAIPFDR